MILNLVCIKEIFYREIKGHPSDKKIIIQ